ncbi:MAG: hypothetical protein C5B56_07855 [Proteobacteria bacterium]|nr:MAG: hypothetical protein C5B56_07855 [Pseudomonadota bacterium]
MGVIAATILAELWWQLLAFTPLRWALPTPAAAFYGPDAFTGYRHRANASGMWLGEHRAFVRISGLGLRDRERDLAHGAGPRTVVVGNSFIEAFQVDLSETAVAVAEDIVSRQHPGAEVVNLGLSGANPAVEVARLQTQGLALRPDLAVIVLQADDLTMRRADNDSEFTAYRPGADQQYHLSYGFRQSRGYRFRTSAAGRAMYALLDYSQAARILNDRRNAGMLAEWPRPRQVEPEPIAGGACAANALDAQIALWIEGRPAEGRAILDAIIRDLAAISQQHRLPIIVATRAIDADCPSLAAKRSGLVAAIRSQLAKAGLQFADLDERVAEKVGTDGVAKLYGFGPSLGRGHLNVTGNRVYGEVLANIIENALPGR